MNRIQQVTNCNKSDSAQNEVQPPTSNTGVENTQVKLDWLQFTFPTTLNLAECQTMLNLDDVEWLQLERGWFGYKSAVEFDGIKLFYDGQSNMGVHCVMSGRAVDSWLTKIEADEDILRALLSSYRALGVKFTRLDPALDDFSPCWNLDTVRQALRDGLIVSRFKDLQNVEKYRIKTGERKGETLYFGSSTSSAQIRIYDKQAEQGVDTPWLRVECQLRDERACAFVDTFCAGVSFARLTCGVIRNYVKICAPSTDTNRSRWEEAEWFFNLLGDTERVSLSYQKSQKTYEETFSHFEKQWGPFMGVMIKRAEGDMSVWMNVANRAFGRWKDKHRQLVMA